MKPPRLESLRLPLIALCAIAAAGVYINSLHNLFALDDVYIIQLNQRVHDLANWRDVVLTPYWPFFGEKLGLYRPLAILAYAVQWAIGGGDAWTFHLTSILLHTGVTILCFLLLEKLTALVPAFVGTLLFAVHPLHTEAVANVVGQAELIAAAATIGACVVHAYRPDGIAVSWPRRIAILVLFLIGIATKESAVVLPALLVITDFAQRRVQLTLRGIADYADALLMPVLLLGAGLATYLLVRFDVLGGTLIGTDAGPTLPFLREEGRVLNAMRVFPEFFRLLFFPQELAADYSPAMILPVESLTAMTAVGAFLLLLIIVCALLTPWFPGVGFPAAWFLISIVTVSNLFFPIGVLIAERTLYLPSFAFSALLAFAWHYAAPRASTYSRRLAPVAVLLAAIAMGYRTWIRNPDWATTPTLLFSMIRDHPESYRAQWVHATWMWQRGELEKARYHYELAYRIYPRDSQFLGDYGNFLLSDGKTDRAITILEQSFAMHDYVPRTAAQLAYAYLVARRFDDALRLAAHAEKIGAERAHTLPIMAYAYDGIGDRNRATAAWRVALRHTHLTDWGTWSFLARTLAMSGYEAEALTAVDRARPFARDSASRATIARLDAAIRSGCYRAAPAGDATGFRNLAGRVIGIPACDPLQSAFGADSVQNANPLHYAMPAATAGPLPVRPGTR